MEKIHQSSRNIEIKPINHYHWSVNTMLVLLFVAYSISILIGLTMLDPRKGIGILLGLALSGGNLIGLVGMLHAKKWGLLVFSACHVLTGVHLGQQFGYTFAVQSTFVLPILLLTLLQLKKDGISGWQEMH